MKKIAIIGKPNVGKSSLFNAIAKRRIAITSDVSGTTRDVRETKVIIKDENENEKEAIILDTGGLDDTSPLFKSVREISLRVAKESDIILYLVDGKIYPDDEDRRIFFELQKLKKELILIVNKIDNDKELERAWEFESFGAKNIFYISVVHRRGIGKLLDFIGNKIEDENRIIVADEEEDIYDFIDKSSDIEVDKNEEIKVAIIGRVNVGKSSLLNALVGEERAVVSEIAGTTIDPVDDYITHKDRVISFVDTAGIRRRGKIEGIEKYALNRTRSMLKSANVTLLVLDASEEFKELDEKIASLIEEFHLASIIVLNKWDKRIDSYKNIVKEVRDRFKFLSYAPIITVSALSKKRIHKINDLIIKVFKNYSKKITTSKLNEVIKNATLKHSIPSSNGQRIKIYFATQYDIKPPTIALVMNRPKKLHFSYKRYLINSIRENFDLEGTPILLYPRKRGERDKENDE